MAAQLRGGKPPTFKDTLGSGTTILADMMDDEKRIVLKNRAAESRSPYVRAHATNPVAWQLWGDEAVELARRGNKLLFISVGYSACHCECLYLLPGLVEDFGWPGCARIRCWCP